MILVGVILIAIGVFAILSPDVMFKYRLFWLKFKYGWMFKNKDESPSDEALLLYRIGGGILVIAGIVTTFR